MCETTKAPFSVSNATSSVKSILFRILFQIFVVFSTGEEVKIKDFCIAVIHFVKLFPLDNYLFIHTSRIFKDLKMMYF